MALIGALLVGIGNVLPWIMIHSSSSFSSKEWTFIGPIDLADSDPQALTNGPFAVFAGLAALAFLLAIALIVTRSATRRLAGGIEALVGVAIAIYAGYKIIDVLETQTSTNAYDAFVRNIVQYYPGPGLALMLVGGLVVALAGIRSAGG